MALLKQIKFGSVSTPIAMTQVAINDDSKNVLSVVGTNTDLGVDKDPVYTIALAVDGKTILKGSTGLETALALEVKAADGATKKARIAMIDNDGAELSSVNIEDIVGNGVITSTAYEPTNGELTITWAGGSTTVVNLGKLLDIDDVAIEETSKNYLKVALSPEASETGGSQAVFGAKIVKVAEATDATTGLVDAKDVKDYVDSKATDLAITAEGDNYINAAVDGTNNKKINVTADVQLLTADAGAPGEYSEVGEQTTDPVAGTLEGVAQSLVDGADVAAKVKTYVDGAIAIEVARADAKVLAAVKALDATVKDGLDSANDAQVAKGKHVGVKVVETDGVLTSISVVENDIASKAALDAEIADRKAADKTLTDNLAAEVTRAKAAETAIDSVVGLTKAAEGETRTFNPTTTYGTGTATVMANMQAIDTKLKEVETKVAGIQYDVEGTTLVFYGIEKKTKA